MRKYGLIGFPLEHSFSPRYFEEKFNVLKLTDCSYKAYPLPHLNDFKTWFFEERVLGLNITIPYKQDVIPLLDRLDPMAIAVGAVNCIALEGQQLVGYNTDVDGFARSIVPFVENKYERALIIGTGGAAKAAAFALNRWGIQVFYLTRKPERPEHLAYSDLTAHTIGFFPLIVNASPIGTFPLNHQCPDIPYHGLTAQHFLFDMVYNPDCTLFMQMGQEQGALVMNGKKMLEIQAELSWEIWCKVHEGQ